MQKSLEKLIEQAEIVFWDFDGVIKDSVEIKSLAFRELFSGHNQDLGNRISLHNERNSGLSRFEKIPLYLSWSDEAVTNQKVQESCSKFSLLVKQSVIDSQWVCGFLEFIKRYHKPKKHILVTATPTKEIKEILQALNIQQFFHKVYGSPISKTDVIKKVMMKNKVNPKHAIMIGDSEGDYKAAKENNVVFFLRSTKLNKDLQKKCKNWIFKDFTNE